MLITAIDQFVKNIPTAMGTKWNAVEPFLNDAHAELVLFSFGQDLMTAIEALADDDQVRKITAKIHALLGYHHAIPFVDVIQTDTGFAVTSNSNLAPASKERVERLITWCVDQIDTLMDMLTEAIRANETLLTDWKKFNSYTLIFDSLFISGNDFARSATVTGSKRQAYLNAKPDIISAQLNILSKVVSKNYMAELVTMVQNNAITADAKPVIALCKQALGQIYNKNQDAVLKTVNEISNLLESDTAKYSTYAASAEYALKHSANYENKQEDSTYFFGM